MVHLLGKPLSRRLKRDLDEEEEAPSTLPTTTVIRVIVL